MGNLRSDCVDALLRVALDIRRHIETVAAEFGLTPPAARTILLLGEPIRMSTLAATAGCEPSHVTAIAQELERQGLAERITDPSDRRARLLALTSAGTALQARLRPAAEANAPVLSELDDERAAELLALIAPSHSEATR